MTGLKKQTQTTLSDRLPYFGFDPKNDVIWLKDGSATLSLKILPKDATLLTDDELEQLRAGLIPVLNHLAEGSVVQFLLMRERSDAKRDETYKRWLETHRSTDETDESSARELLFNSRKEAIETQLDQGLIFQTRCYLTLRVLPEFDPKPGRTMGPFAHFGYWFQNKKTLYRNRARIIEDLSSAFEALATGMSSIGFEVLQVPHEERMKLIYEWLNPERSQALPPPQPKPSTLLSEQVGLSDLIETSSGVSLGRAEIEIASLKALPEISVPAAMQDLACAAIPFSMLFTLYVLPQTQERERLLRKQRLAQGMASGNMVRNLMAEAQLRDIEDTLGALISSGEKIFGVSFHMIGIKERA